LVRHLLLEVNTRLSTTLDLSRGYQDPLNCSWKQFPFICLTQTPLDQALKQYYSPKTNPDTLTDYAEIIRLLLSHHAPTSKAFAHLARRFQSEEILLPPNSEDSNPSAWGICTAFLQILRGLPEDITQREKIIMELMCRGAIPCGDGISVLWQRAASFGSVETSIIGSLDLFIQGIQAPDPTFPDVSVPMLVSNLFQMRELVPYVSDWHSAHLARVNGGPGYFLFPPHLQMDLLYCQQLVNDKNLVEPPYEEHFHRCQLCKCADTDELLRFLRNRQINLGPIPKQFLRRHCVNGKRFIILGLWSSERAVPQNPWIHELEEIIQEYHYDWEEH